jgi:NAD(P)-dependent dehydrogenase (short-subunit alcohol dehydrogenase family)
VKVLAITGAGQGIGRAIAYHFAKAGYWISLADPDARAGREAARHIEAMGGKALFMPVDVAKPAAVDRWMRQTVSKLGCPDVLVNNAGIMRRVPFLKLSVRDFDRVIATNLRGVFLCAQAAAKQMTKRRHAGAIINIASTRAYMSEPGTESYAASKGGIVALTHAMAISLGPKNIRVNAIAPGWIEVGDWQYSARAKKPVHSKADREQHPVGRVGKPEDIAEACLFLSERAGFMTGQTVIIDGGMSVKMIYAE